MVYEPIDLSSVLMMLDIFSFPSEKFAGIIKSEDTFFYVDLVGPLMGGTVDTHNNGWRKR